MLPSSYVVNSIILPRRHPYLSDFDSMVTGYGVCKFGRRYLTGIPADE
jgi:hypothetical protein